MQEILVAIIGIVVGAIIIYKIYGFFFSKNPKTGSCGCSNCHCSSAKKHVK